MRQIDEEEEDDDEEVMMMMLDRLEKEQAIW